MTNTIWADETSFEIENPYEMFTADKFMQDTIRITMTAGGGQGVAMDFTKEEATAMCNFIMGQFK